MTPGLRTYGGITGAERRADRKAQLIEAGLTLMGSSENTFTVRAVCAQAGLTSRYFYENFDDRDALAAAVYDAVAQDLATAILAAIDQIREADRKTRAGVTAAIRLIGQDPRRGRVLFDPDLSGYPVIAQRRSRSAQVFATLLSEQASSYFQIAATPRLEFLSQFLIGGLGQSISAWLNGRIELSEAELIESCTALLLSASELR